MGEAVEADSIPDQNNKEDAEAEVLPERDSGAPEYLDLDASAHPKDTKYQDVESSASSEVPEDVPKYCEVPVSGYRDEGITQNTPEYVSTMDLDVANINKNDKHT